MPKPHLIYRTRGEPHDAEIIAVTEDGEEIDLTRIFPITGLTLEQGDPAGSWAFPRLRLESSLLDRAEISVNIDPDEETLDRIESWIAILRGQKKPAEGGRIKALAREIFERGATPGPPPRIETESAQGCGLNLDVEFRFDFKGSDISIPE